MAMGGIQLTVHLNNFIESFALPWAHQVIGNRPRLSDKKHENLIRTNSKTYKGRKQTKTMQEGHQP